MSGRFDTALRYRSGADPAQTHFTPGYVLDAVRADLGGSIGLDPCTTADNPTGADAFYTVEQDGLTCVWGMYPSVFVNPPYGKAREPWVSRCVAAASRGQRVILLMPAATDTRVFRLAATTSTAIVYVTGRVKFGTLRPNRRQRAASHPSALIGWGTSLDACSCLGWRSMFWAGETAE
jgi:DNA N-6-adenine-methyltransferase (Dam)